MEETHRSWDSVARASAAALALAAAACDMSAAFDETRGEPPTVDPREGTQAAAPSAQPQPEIGPARPSMVSMADLKDLQTIASMQEEADHITVTLAGPDLFGAGKTTLHASAGKTLDRVGDALETVASERLIVIEGHTDSRGRAADNERLSQERADAVREHLIAGGLDGTKLRAVGKGEKEPVADNATPEGRAQNRRIEIAFPRKPHSEPFAAR